MTGYIKTGFVALLLSMTAQASYAAEAANTESMTVRADTYIAVYYSSTNGNYGWGRSENLDTAKALARGYCNSDSCEYIFWTRNACAVLASGAGNGYGWAWNSDRTEAIQTALQNCSNFTSSCKVIVSECT